ncbi:MAG: hypothetical protein WCV85_03255 [Patescibacteria group bacterium]|jgi:aromatic ring-opening dioxygenase LigB subunit
MAIVAAAFVSHSPLLLPTTKATHAKRLADLHNAMDRAMEHLYAAKVDSIIAFSPHALQVGNTFTFNLSPTLEAHFDDFGDVSTVAHATGDPSFGYRLKEQLEALLPVSAVHDPRLNYGSGIPMLFLNALPTKPRWVNISTRLSTLDEHIRFGVALQEELQNTTHRIGILASGDLTARFSDAAPQGKHPKAETFVQAWHAALQAHTLPSFLRSCSAEQIQDLGACGAWSMAQLLGSINSLQMHHQEHYAAAPYGVAYSVVTWTPA